MRSASSVRASIAVAALAVALVPALAGTALAGPDPVQGGRTTLTLALKKVKVKATGSAIKDGNELTLPNVGGSFDPVTGAGTLQNGGTLQFKSKRRKVKVKKIETTFGAGGAIAAKVGKRKIKRLATVKGGTSSRDDFGGRVSGAQAKLTAKGAKALLGKKSKKTLGTLSTVTVPKTVEVLPQGSVVFEPDVGTTLKFAEKGVNPLTGVEPVTPGTMHVGPPITFEFPITGGSASLGLTDGRINSAGGLKLTKSIAQSAGCDAQHPVGAFIQQTNLSPDLGLQLLIADAATQAGPLVRGGVATMDLSGATSTVDHATKEITLDGAKLKLTNGSATILNQVAFGTSANGCGVSGSDFVDGDVLGTLSLTAKLR
jgi:hypothetical protein